MEPGSRKKCFVAADLGTLRVSIDGGAAVSSAAQITQALKEMGAAGDTATKSVQELQSIAAKPIGGSGQSSAQVTSQLVAGFERARQVMQEMQQQAKGMSDVGLGGEFAGIAAGANELAAALTEAIGIFKDMVTEGANVEEILAAMKEQAMGLPEGFERLSAMEKMTFQQMQADIEGSIQKYKAFQNAQDSVAKAAQESGKIFQETEKANQREISQTEAAERRRMQQEQQATNIRRAATQEMRTSPLGGAVSTMMNVTMGAQMMGQGGFMGPAMGIQMLSTGLSEAAAGATAFGGAFALLIPILAGAAAAIAAVTAGIKFMSDALSAGAAQEKLTVQLTAMLGSAQAARTELEQIKDFTTGGAAGFLSFDDAQKGVERLQTLSGGLISVNQGLQILAGAQAVSGVGTEQLAQEIGKASNMMLAQVPIRYQLLTTLVQSKVITAQNAVELENMSRKGATGTAVFSAFQQMLHQNDAAAKQASTTFDGVIQRLDNIAKTRVLEPIGEALAKGLEKPLQMLGDMLDNPAIKSGIATFSYNLEVALLTVFYLIRDQGIIGAWQTGVETVSKYIQDNWPNMLLTVATTSFENFKTAGQSFITWFVQRFRDDWMQLWTEINALKLPGPKPGATGLEGQTGIGGVDIQATKDLDQQIRNAAGLTKTQADVTKQQSDKTTVLNQTTAELTAATQQLNLTFTAFNQQSGLLGWAGVGGAGGGGAPLFPGASKGMSEYAPGDRQTHDVMYGPLGQMKTGDIALSEDKMVQLFGSISNALGKFVDIVDQNGNILLAHQRVWDTSFKSPGNPNVNTFEVWGRTWDAAGKVIASTTATTQTALQKAQAEAKATAGSAPGAGTSKLQGVPDVEKALADQKAAMKAMDDEIKILTTDWGQYGKQTKLINDQEKEGIISITQATQQKLLLDKQIGTEISDTITKLTAQEAAIKAAYPTADVTKYDDELKKLHEDLDQVRQDMQKLAGTDVWSSFIRGVTQATNSWGTFGQQVTQVGKQITDQLASGIGNGLTQLVEGTGNVKQAFVSMLDAMIKAIMDFLAKQLIQQLISLIGTLAGGGGGGGLTSGLSSIGSSLGGHATGGLVNGPSGTDQVPSMLTAGEYVLTPKAVDKYGIQMIDAMNRGTFQPGGPGTLPQKYASGGLVGAATSSQNVPPSQSVSSNNTASTLAIVTNVTVPGSSGTSPSGQQGGSGNNSQNGMTPQELAQLQQSISLVIRDEIVRQKRPGGLLSKQQLSI